MRRVTYWDQSLRSSLTMKRKYNDKGTSSLDDGRKDQ